VAPVRRLVPIALALAALAGCGSGAKKPAADPGRELLGALILAAGSGDTEALRGLLSAESRDRVGPTALAALQNRLRPLAGGYRLVVSERITDTFGLVAAVHQPYAFAAALRKVGAIWRLELGGPVRITPLGPDPGARQVKVRQLAAAVDGAAGKGEALLYLDGFTVPEAKVYRFGQKLSIVANLPIRVARGRHTVVVFAGAAESASALAWTFVVPR
jgi:hypothetical protein